MYIMYINDIHLKDTRVLFFWTYHILLGNYCTETHSAHSLIWRNFGLQLVTGHRRIKLSRIVLIGWLGWK